MSLLPLYIFHYRPYRIHTKKMGDRKLTDPVMNLYYLTVLFIGFALISSFVIVIHCVRDSNVHVFNTWQFPMLLALFFDAVVVLIKHG
jgi:uncharacterized membrane protein YqjE